MVKANRRALIVRLVIHAGKARQAEALCMESAKWGTVSARRQAADEMEPRGTTGSAQMAPTINSLRLNALPANTIAGIDKIRLHKLRKAEARTMSERLVSLLKKDESPKSISPAKTSGMIKMSNHRSAVRN